MNKLKSKRPLNSIAVTGTNGKTSVVWYISQILLINNLNCKTHGTLGYYVNCKKKYNTNLTTPNFEILHQNSYTNKKKFI